jgi:hypothetical protein
MKIFLDFLIYQDFVLILTQNLFLIVLVFYYYNNMYKIYFFIFQIYSNVYNLFPK